VTAALTPDVPQLDPAEGARQVDAGAFLLDVREPDEWAAGHAGAATHVPLGQLPGRLAEIPADRPVVAVCRAGGRSQQAATFLRQQGIDAANLQGGMQAWAAAGLDVTDERGGPGSVI